MGIFKQSVADLIEQDARRALDEGRSMFVAQFRGDASHSASMTRPITGIAEKIEAVEAVGWRMDQFTAMPYKDNITIVALFRRPL